MFTNTLPGAFDSSEIIFWSASEGRYVCYFRFNNQSVRSIPSRVRWGRSSRSTGRGKGT